jgi:hypothetical protein
MNVSRLLSYSITFLPLIGLGAFYFDSSFVDLRLFFPFLDPDSLNLIFFITITGCVMATIELLYIIHKSLKVNQKIFRNLYVRNKFVVLSQCVVLSIIIITVWQNYQEVSYYFFNVTILIAISYSLSLFFMGLLAIRFFNWYSYERQRMVLGFALAVCMIIVFLMSSIAYAAFELYTPFRLYTTSLDLTVQVSGKNPYPNPFGSLYYYSYIFTFLSVWSITMLFLRSHLGKTRPIIFYFALIIPLIYFLIPVIPQVSNYIAKLIVQSPHLYGSLYLVFFSGTGPLGGVIFSVGLLLFARKFRDQVIRNSLMISALGMLFFFVINQNPPLVENVNPPFGIISKSFVGLSCYMIFLGFYSTVIYLSRKDTVTHVVLREMARDSLFGSVLRSEQERKVRSVIDKCMTSLQEHQKVESKEMSKEDIDNLITLVRGEISKHEKGEDG